MPNKEADDATRSGETRRRVRLKDVAEAVGISLSQASAALSGRPGVSMSTRTRVLEVATSLGYQPSEQARALAGFPQRRTVHVVTAGFDPHTNVPTHYLGTLLSGLLVHASEADIDVRLTSLARDRAIDDQFGELLARDSADAVAFIPFVELAVEDIAPLQRSRVPFVVVNRHFGDHQVPVVSIDFSTAAELAVDHLVELGHRCITLVRSDRSSTLNNAYTAGWLRAKQRWAGRLEAATETVLPSGSVLGTRTDLLTPALETLTGVVCTNEQTAHELLKHCHTEGIAVPEELSVVTFGDSVAPYTTPAMTSVHLNTYDLGGSAVAALRQMLAGEYHGEHRRILPTLQVRSSTAAITSG